MKKEMMQHFRKSLSVDYLRSNRRVVREFPLAVIRTIVFNSNLRKLDTIPDKYFVNAVIGEITEL